ncbi:MAG: trmE [Rickettsiaceae bacterium]|nr:trmE [Rickettsiaceae bacterium]
MDTIFALSSAPGKAGVSVFRISGINALRAIDIICPDVTLKPREAQLVNLYSPENNIIFDKAIVIYFKAPNSFTGEDVIEFHTHGSIAIGNMLIESLMSIEGLRLAEPGEFSKRAFLNNKMDLTAAEGLADLIEAETSQQVRQAIRQMSGELEKLYEGWRHDLLKIQSLLEAYIDFPDEEIPDSVLDGVNANLCRLKQAINSHLNDNTRGERLRNGIKLAIFGPPNAGKSSLLNYLARREVAIVSTKAGTTRDVLEIHLDINGYPIVIADTAGIRATEDEIEAEGIKRAQIAASQADIKIFIFDIAEGMPKDSHFLELIDDNTIIIANKIDLKHQRQNISYQGNKVLALSVKEKAGMELLLDEITRKAETLARPSETPAITRLRYRKSLNEALILLSNFNFDKDIVLAAEDIRLAARALSQITGKISVDEILGEIFANFCIGK